MDADALAARAPRAALLVGLAACSSKDDDGGTDNPNGPSRRLEHRPLLGDLGQRRHRLRQQLACLPFADCPERHRLRPARRARDARQRQDRHRAQPVGAGVGGRTRDRKPGAAAGPRQHRQLRRAAAAVRVAQLDARDDLRRRQRRQRGRQRHRARPGRRQPVGWGTAFATGFGRDLATIVDGVRARAPNAKIILLNPPNGAGLPYVATRPRDSCASCRRSRCASPPRPTSRRRAACWSST